MNASRLREGRTDRVALRSGWYPVVTGLVLAIGLAGTIVGSLYTKGVASRNRDGGASDTAQGIAGSLATNMARDVDLSAAVGAIILANPATDNKQFRALFGYLGTATSYPSSLGFGYVASVRAIQLAKFAQQSFADPIQAPAVRWTQVIPNTPEARYCLPSLGVWRFPAALPSSLNLCATPDGAYLIRAAASGSLVPVAAITTEQTLVNYLDALSARRGAQAAVIAADPMDEVMIFFGPVYKSGLLDANVGAREQSITGWTVSIFDASSLLRTAEGMRRGVSLQLALAVPGKPAVVIASTPAPGPGSTSVIVPFSVPNVSAQWYVTVRVPAGGGLTPSEQALLVLGAGLSFIVLFLILIASMASSRSRALRLVDEKTHDLQQQALHDDLTKLPNRTLVHETAAMMLARARRYGTVASALFLDIDDFKDINDTLGHAVGDDVLREVAIRLKCAAREVDTVGRLGGDEFVVLVESGSPHVVAARILENLAVPFEVKSALGRPIAVAASIGIATSTTGTADELLADADVALYRAKATGKGRFVAFEATMRSGVEQRVQLHDDLRRAVERGEFFLVYQPIVHLGSLEVLGVEALLRWQHPTLGLVSPVDFIPALEETGLIVKVGLWVLGKACAQAAIWRSRGLDLAMSVNVSPRQLDSDGFVEAVRETARERGVAPGDVILEVTESALIENERTSIAVLEALRTLGFRIAIDDFGTGYSSLSRLRKLPFDMLKIDKSFIGLVGSDAIASTIVRAIVELCGELGVRVIAEGIEDPGQLVALHGMGCPEGQGYIFSRPIAADLVESFAVRGGVARALEATGAAAVALPSG